MRGAVGVGARVRAAAAVAGELVAAREGGGGVRGGLAVREGDRGGGELLLLPLPLPRLLLLPLQLQLLPRSACWWSAACAACAFCAAAPRSSSSLRRYSPSCGCCHVVKPPSSE